MGDNFKMKNKENDDLDDDDDESQEELYSDPGSILHRQLTAGSIAGSIEPIKFVNSVNDLCVLSETDTPIGYNTPHNDQLSIAFEQEKAMQACHDNNNDPDVEAMMKHDQDIQEIVWYNCVKCKVCRI